ncbi:MAG: hypothetical protein ACI8V2_001859 [Candidatus Latescibacterota bacterium]|jgi:hypothetical protein
MYMGILLVLHTCEGDMVKRKEKPICVVGVGRGRSFMRAAEATDRDRED